MRKYEKEYLEWLATNPVCACGCGEPMTSSFASFVSAMKLYGRPPQMKATHSKRRRPKKFAKEFEQWLATNPTCQCGCGQRFDWNYGSFSSYYSQKQKFPSYLSGHKFKLERMTNVINFNGCSIILTKSGSRCNEYNECDKRLECLEFVTIINKGYGWEKL